MRFLLPFVSNANYTDGMKRVAPFILLAAFAAGATPLPQLPAPQFADTEVSTNCPINALGGRFGEYTFTLSFNGTPSNCVEVALGTDANANGVVSAEETDFAYGWRNGRWFLDVDSAADRVYEDADEHEGARTLALHVEFLSSGAMRLLSCEADGVAIFTDITSTAPVWGDVSGWTSVQLLARGVVSPGETFIVQQTHIGTLILFQ